MLPAEQSDYEPEPALIGHASLLGEGLWLRLHRLLVHFVRQEGLDPTAQPAVGRALIDCGEAASERDLTGPALAAVIPHLVGVAGAAVGGTGEELLAAELCNAAGRALHRAGELRATRPWYERALVIRGAIAAAGPSRHRHLTNLAELLWSQGELAAARSLLKRALAIRERVLGPGHTDTADSLNNMGVLLKAQGELAAARPLLERALAMWERCGGPITPTPPPASTQRPRYAAPGRSRPGICLDRLLLTTSPGARAVAGCARG